MDADKWKSVFAYLEFESRFQGAVAAVSGAAAAWWLKTLLSPSKDAPPVSHPMASRLAGALLAMSSFLFLVEQGRLAKMYGELARHLALGTEPTAEWTALLVREDRTVTTVVAWLPYYSARGLLLAVVCLVAWMLFARPRS